MKIAGLLAVFALVLTAPMEYASAQTIHLITIADTKDANIGTGAAANTKQIEDFIKSVASELKVPLARQDVAGTAFSCQRIRQEIAALNASQDDVIIFYYSGHGFRTPTNITKFPELFCGEEAFTGDAPRLAGIASELKAKGARLTITVADSCNVLFSQPLPAAPPGAIASVPVSRLQQYRSLFLRHKGSMVMSGSVKDQFSWYLPSTGFFTRQFVKALDDATRPGKQGLWSEVLPAAAREIEVPFGSRTIAQKPELESAITPLAD